MLVLPLGLDRFTFEAPTLIELHQATVHFPIALLLTSVGCEIGGALFKKAESLRATAFWSHILGTISAAIAVALGWFGNPVRGKNDEFAQMVNVHQWWGIAALSIFMFLAIWRLRRVKNRDLPGKFERACYGALSLLGVFVIAMTGWLGGHLGA